MAKYKLGDICEIVSGSTPKTGIDEYWDGNIKWITPAELNDDTYIINDSVRKITELAVMKTGLSSFPKGTVILSSRAPIGKVAIAGCEMYCNQGFKNLICSDKINSKYLYWFLKGNTAYLNSLGRGATFKEISKRIVSEIEINVPNIEKQEEVVSTLEKISEIIALRKKELRDLDDLIKARFVEMFGNPITNPKGYTKITVEEAIEAGYIEKPFDGNHGGKHPKASEYVETGIPFLMANNVNDGTVDLANCSFITERRANRLDKGFAKDNDVLITHKGTIGRTAVLRTDYKFVMLTPQVAAYRVKRGITSEYLCGYFGTDYFQNDMKMLASSGGSTRAYAGITAQLKLRLIIPPLDEQREYTDFVHQVDKSKVAVQKALDETQLLFDSLMQQYFG